MDIEKIKKDYKQYKNYYQDLQKEVYNFLVNFKNDKKASIDIYDICQRPREEIKELDSIIKNIKERPKRYKNLNELTDIKDIAGNRITCHCRTDRENIINILGGELRQNYIDITEEEKNEGPYRAYHFNFAKRFKVNEDVKKLYCEIQVRTILENAWAIQDSEYLYKNKKKEGEPQILSKAVSDILYGCEGLWDLVKAKSREEEVEIGKILEIKETTDKKIKTTKSEVEEEIREKKLDKWFDKHQRKSFANLHNLGITAFMEIKMFLPDLSLNVSKNDLKDAARKSQIHTFGWPIAAYIDRQEYSPKPDLDGIVAEIAIKNNNDKSYDYWTIKGDGSFYLMKSLFEDKRKPNYLFFNTRTVRIAEVLMYALNLYSNLGVDENRSISITIKHGGFKNKIMGATGNRLIAWERKSIEDEVDTTVITSINEIKENITDLVIKYTTPLFELFDFFNVERKIIDDIVANYINGKVI